MRDDSLYGNDINNEVNHLYSFEPYHHTITEFVRGCRKYGTSNSYNKDSSYYNKDSSILTRDRREQNRLKDIFGRFRSYENIDTSKLLGFSRVSLLDKFLQLKQGTGLGLYKDEVS